MKTDAGQCIPVWTADTELPVRSPLTADARADICIVGAGIAGLSTAWHLVQSGVSVVVLDDGPIAGGETSRTTAHLSNALDDRYYELERLFGQDGARRAAESHTAAIERIGEIVAREEIDCGYERLDGYLFAPPGETVDELSRELDAARRAGLTGVERVPRPHCPTSTPDRACASPARARSTRSATSPGWRARSSAGAAGSTPGRAPSASKEGATPGSRPRAGRWCGPAPPWSRPTHRSSTTSSRT